MSTFFYNVMLPDKYYNGMYKYKDYPIKFFVKLPEQKKTFAFIFYVRQTIQEVALKLAELLNLTPFLTQFEFYFHKSSLPLKLSSTLLQNYVRDGDTVVAKLLQTYQTSIMPNEEVSKYNEQEINEPSEYQQQSKYLIKKDDFFGLQVYGTCYNKKCHNYGQKLVYNFGLGEFSYSQIVNNTKCVTCPYRDLSYTPSIKVEYLKLFNCIWKFNGRYYDKNNCLHEVDDCKFNKVSGENSSQIYDILNNYRWVELNLIIKQL